jgi:hypothetical protein
MNIFDLRERLVRDYGEFIRGFLKIRDPGWMTSSGPS